MSLYPFFSIRKYRAIITHKAIKIVLSTVPVHNVKHLAQQTSFFTLPIGRKLIDSSDPKHAQGKTSEGDPLAEKSIRIRVGGDRYVLQLFC